MRVVLGLAWRPYGQRVLYLCFFIASVLRRASAMTRESQPCQLPIAHTAENPRNPPKILMKSGRVKRIGGAYTLVQSMTWLPPQSDVATPLGKVDHNPPHGIFNHQRHLNRRDIFKQDRATALAEWWQLAA